MSNLYSWDLKWTLKAIHSRDFPEGEALLDRAYWEVFRLRELGYSGTFSVSCLRYEALLHVDSLIWFSASPGAQRNQRPKAMGSSKIVSQSSSLFLSKLMIFSICYNNRKVTQGSHQKWGSGGTSVGTRSVPHSLGRTSFGNATFQDWLSKGQGLCCCLTPSWPRKAKTVDELLLDAGTQRQLWTCSALVPFLPGCR